MLDLAIHIVATKAGHFEPDKFADRYENALETLVKKKQRGENIEIPKERPPAPVVNLMDALRQSAAAEHGRRRPQGAVTRRPRTPSARTRKAS
jgi:DNA end-binding protein Ku